MSKSGQGRPDSFASTLKVERSAVGSGSGRHETARPMSQLGHEDAFPLHRPNAGYVIGKETVAGARESGRDAPTVDIPEPLAAGLNKELGSG